MRLLRLQASFRAASLTGSFNMRKLLLNTNTNRKKQGNGFLSAVLGTLLVLAGVVAYGIVSLLVCRLFISIRVGDSVGGGLMTFWLTSVGISFVVFEAAFVTWQIKRFLASTGRDEGNKMGRIFKIVLLSAIAIAMILSICSANVFTEIKDDSISSVLFVTTKEYRWDESRNDVLSYSLVCDEYGVLSFSVTMKDGTNISILDSVNSLSDQFKEKHVNCLGYAAHLAESFNESGYTTIEKNIYKTTVENATKLFKASEKEADAIKWSMIERILIASNISFE